jgi:mono/diheme cytochrome c family protein
MFAKSILSAAIIAVIAPAAWSEGAGDVVRGHAYSQMLCASCHAIDATSASTNLAAPPFRSLKLDFKTGAEFATFLNTQHPSITGPLVTEHQADDITTFVATLKGPAK